MGKGDQRSRRGKIWRGTFGKRRPKKRNENKPAPVAEAPAAPKPEKKSPAVKKLAPPE